MKKYKLSLATADNSTYSTIVKDPTPWAGGIISATQIAKFAGFPRNEMAFKYCEPIEIIVGGAFILEEYTGDILE